MDENFRSIGKTKFSKALAKQRKIRVPDLINRARHSKMTKNLRKTELKLGNKSNEFKQGLLDLMNFEKSNRGYNIVNYDEGKAEDYSFGNQGSNKGKYNIRTVEGYGPTPEEKSHHLYYLMKRYRK